jgi:RNase P subunit RPR2
LVKTEEKVLEMTEEEMIKILIQFLLANNQTQIGVTEYERCIQLMDSLSTKALNEIHKIWKERMNGK